MDLFSDDRRQWREALGPEAVILRGFLLDAEHELLQALEEVVATAPFRHMETPGGYRMSVAMTSCGRYGWVTDRTGYRYSPVDPATGLAWPAMPALFHQLASEAASQAGFCGFAPDACLINRYAVRARLSLHQDRDEEDLDQPVVSFSLGLPATFQFGGLKRNDRAERVSLAHGDVVVWGGRDRLRYHGILPLRAGSHPLLGSNRINLTFRRAKK